MKKVSSQKQAILFVVIILAVIAFDQITKYFAFTVLQNMPGQTTVFVPYIMNFRYVENTGAAFSMFSSATWLLAVLSGVMAAVVIYLLFRYRKIDSWLFKISMCFIAGGAIGNLIDRIFRGFVVDMLEFDFVNFAIFNVADCFVCIGAVMLGIFIIWFWDKSKKEDKHEQQNN